MLTGLRVDSDGCYHAYGPDPSALGLYMSGVAMYYAIGFGMSGIVVAVTHCSNETSQVKLRTEAYRILVVRHGLESWLGEWREAANNESSRGEMGTT